MPLVAYDALIGEIGGDSVAIKNDEDIEEEFICTMGLFGIARAEDYCKLAEV